MPAAVRARRRHVDVLDRDKVTSQMRGVEVVSWLIHGRAGDDLMEPDHEGAVSGARYCSARQSSSGDGSGRHVVEGRGRRVHHMRLTHKHAVETHIDTVWDRCTDLHTVGGCFPGAAMTSVDGDDSPGRSRARWDCGP